MLLLLAEENIPFVLWYQQPADDWETQALPIGNSYMGAMIFGGVWREQVQYNEKTFWTGGPQSVENYNFGNKEGAYDSLKHIRKIINAGENPNGNLFGHVCGNVDGYGSYQNFGNIFIETGHYGESNYRRELNINQSFVKVQYDIDDVHYTRDYFASFPKRVVAMRFSSNSTGKITINITSEGVHGDSSDETVTSEGTRLKLRGKTIEGYVIGGDGNVGNGMTYESQLEVINQRGQIYVVDNTVCVTGADSVVLILSAGTEYLNYYPDYRGEDPHKAVTARVDAASVVSFDQLFAEHQDDYAALFRRQLLYLGSKMDDQIPTDQLLEMYKQEERVELENLLFNYGKYLLISSSRGKTLPANLQGVWCGSNTPRWQSDYHFNINLQMNYWPSYVTNLEETIEPLRDYLRSLEEPGRYTAKIHCGVDKGWVVTTMNNPFGFTAVGWAFDWGWAPTANAWICQNIWESYLFSQNITVLEQEIYPIMKGVADFWTDFLVNYTHSDGKRYLVSSPSYSPEQGPRTVATAFDQQLIRQFFSDYVDAVNALHKEEDYPLRDRIQEQIKLLFPTLISKNGTIQEWKDDIYYGDIHHRHCSHLVGLYPGKEINKDTPDLFNAARQSLLERGDEGTGWSMANKINLWARLLDGSHSHTVLATLLRNGIYSNLLDTHPPFYIDGNFGATSGIAEMLIYSHMGYIHILPALGSAWKQGYYKGFKARGNFEVSAAWEESKLTELEITSGSGNLCTVEYPQIMKSTVTCDGKEVSISVLNENQIQFDTYPGKVYVFKLL